MSINTNKLVNYNFIYLITFAIPFQPLINKNIFIPFIIGISLITMIVLLNNGRRFKITDFIKFYMSMVIYGVLSLIYSKDIISTKTILLQILPYYFCCIIISWYILSDRENSFNRIMKFLKSFIMGTLILCIICIASDIRSFNIYTRIGNRLLGNQYTMFTYYLMISITIVIWLYFKEDKKRNKVYNFIIIIFLYIMIISSAVRKALLIPIVFFMSYIFIKSRNKNNIIKGIIKIILIIFILLLIYYLLMKNEYFASTAGRRIDTFINGITNKGPIDNSFNERRLLVNSAWECYKKYPILGYGFGAFREYANTSIGLRLYAHNNYLELLASSGIIGFSIYYGMIIKIFISLCRGLKKYKSDIFIFGIAFLLSLIINDFAAVTYLSFPYMIIISIISSLYKFETNNISNKDRMNLYEG